jgi:Septum formation
LPPDLVAGDAEAIYSNSDGDLVAVMSVIPQLTWRGDPGFVPDLIDALTGVEPADAPDGIYSTSTVNGAELELWSTGDGFVIASSLERDAAAAYLSALDEVTDPNTAWSTGTCLFLEHDEGLPYAPFPPDVVVPCSGAHNAEVLFGSTTGADLDVFDAEAIEIQRNYDCDRAYNEAFGTQRTQAPGLVTYMPDEDEWARGDRYLACVVIIDRNEGRQMFSGAMANLDDLAFTPEVGSCLLDNLPADTVECSLPHVYQFVGETTIDADTWPGPDDPVFDDACAPFLDGLEAGPGTLEVLAIGLGPYAFENGDRTVRCMAFAIADGFLVDVIGSFDGPWRLLGTDGVAT